MRSFRIRALSSIGVRRLSGQWFTWTMRLCIVASVSGVSIIFSNKKSLHVTEWYVVASFQIAE